MSVERYLFLGGHRKYGTTLLLNLFDGQESCCLYRTDISVLYGYFPVFCEQKFSAEERLKRLDSVIFGTLERLRESHGLDERLPVEVMRSYFFDGIDRENLDRIDVIIRQLIESFRTAVDFSTTDRPLVIVKETSLEIYARQLSDWFRARARSRPSPPGMSSGS